MVGDIIYSFCVKGSYTQFWYFPALIGATLLLYLIKGKGKCEDKILLPVIAVLYGFGVMGNSYYGFLIQYHSKLLPVYEAIFGFVGVDKLGVCFALFYLYMGYLMKKYDKTGEHTKKERGLYLVCFLGCMALMLAERKWLLDQSQYTMGDMTFAMIPTTYFLMKLCLGIDGKGRWEQMGIWLRKSSTLVFCSHLFISFYLHKGMSVIGLGYLMQYSLYRFLLIYFGTLVFSAGVIWLSNKKRTAWLKNLY